jgi:serine/threonine protein kinase
MITSIPNQHVFFFSPSTTRMTVPWYGEDAYAAPETRLNTTPSTATAGNISSTADSSNTTNHVLPFYDARASDIWALGIILYMLLTKRCLFRCANILDERYLAYRNAHSLESYLQQIDPEFFFKVNYQLISLLSQMLSIDPRKRPNYETILDHPCLQVMG